MYMIPYTNRNSSSLMDLFDEFERSVFGESGRRLPAFSTDIRDEGDHYMLEAELPGFRKEDIDLDVKDGYLTISASRQRPMRPSGTTTCVGSAAAAASAAPSIWTTFRRRALPPSTTTACWS